jgi:PAS domain S-box-containing protein
MTIPVRTILGNVRGVIAAEVNLKFMWDLVGQLAVGETGHAYVVDRDGRLIAFGDTGRVLNGERLNHLEPVIDFMNHSNREGNAEVNTFTGIAGTTVVGTHVSLGTPDWAVMTELPLKEAYHPVVQSAGISAVIILAMAIVAALIGTIVARRLAVPILHLAGTATRIEGGETGLQASLEGPLEVIRLAGAFNNMTERLRVMLDAEEERSRKLEQEVAQRIKMERALRENEQLLTNILESMDEGILVLNRDFEYQVFNRKLEEIGGTPREAAIGKKPWDVYPELKTSYMRKKMEKAMIGEVTGTSAVKLFVQNNEPKWVTDKLAPLKDGQGNIVGIVGVITDITEKKIAEDELHRLRNYLSNIIDSMPSVLVGVNGDGRITQWNKKAEQQTGIAANAAQGQMLSDVFSQMTSEMRKITTSIQSRQIIQTQKKPRAVDGEIYYEDITIYPLVANDVQGAVIRIDNVTERVRLEEMMIQSEKMLSVGGLAAGMAHEINNPLAGILQNSAVLYNRLFGVLPANHKAAEAAGTTMLAIGKYLELRKLRGLLDNIRSSGHRASTIVRNMLSFARKSDRANSSNDLRALLDQTISLLQTDYDIKKHYDFKQIKIKKQYDESVPLVPCDGSKVQQVFLNILKNGAEAMVETMDDKQPPTFILRVQNDSAWVRVEIEDNGPGMDNKTRRSIFDPFFTTKPVGKGTGLGMSVSYFIITEDHGGELGAYAADSGGTLFVIRLPKGGKQDI